MFQIVTFPESSPENCQHKHKKTCTMHPEKDTCKQFLDTLRV